MSVTTLPEPKPITTRVNAAIRVGMARRNIAAGRLATDVGLTYQALYRRMSGHVAWNVDELADVAGALDMDVRDLFAEER